jgi:lactate dehydrogenase-like 2-hydroxyacid dehydrogenase
LKQFVSQVLQLICSLKHLDTNTSAQCDVVTVNCPLHEGTRGLVNAELLKHFKKGAWLVNTARGAICDKNAVAAALKSGHLAGYSGVDVSSGKVY